MILAMKVLMCVYHFKLRLCSIDARVLISRLLIMIILVPCNDARAVVDEGL